MALDIPVAQAQELLAALFERSPHGIAITDLAGRYLRANPAFERLLGYAEADLRRLSMADLVPAEDRERSRRGLVEMAAGSGNRLELEKRYLRKDGRAVLVRDTVVKLAAGGMGPGGFV